MDQVILRGEIPQWISGSGYGSGYGYGDGYGDGSGYGSGSGYGDGYGSGSGYGDGYGYGDGSGDGYGYGDGDGSGSGAGYGSYWQATIECFALKWPVAQQQRMAELQASGAKIAFWRSNADGSPANHSHRGAWTLAAPGVMHEVAGPLQLCSHRAVHATMMPAKWEGERWWIVALIGDVVGDDDKYGALKREIIGECL